ncbi:glutaminase [Microbacterium sp. Marseille-Q6965]|uniref:glutaminase n=1 Tax=Microbacterium sp. Marseille-Q6965 TaxID=2965072 RepID=UPI0021B813E0|nr:glutaminase [Microbacterium sp. Marseille-Q6965]
MDPVALFENARRRLDPVPREALGRLEVPGRLRRGLGARPRIVPDGEAWRVGVLLIGDEAVFEVGEVLRAKPERRRGFTAESARQRAAAAAMCVRGGFAEGTTVNVDHSPLDLAVVAAGGSAGPLLWRDGALLVRWTAGGALMPLDAYLRERIATLRGR